MATEINSDGFALFVSCVPGAVVTRFGSRTYIGAHRTMRGIEWEPDLIVAIPDDEAARYAKEYARAIRDESLVLRKAEDWVAQQQLSAETDAERVAARAPKE